MQQLRNSCSSRDLLDLNRHRRESLKTLIKFVYSPVVLRLLTAYKFDFVPSCHNFLSFLHFLYFSHPLLHLSCFISSDDKTLLVTGPNTLLVKCLLERNVSICYELVRDVKGSHRLRYYKVIHSTNMPTVGV